MRRTAAIASIALALVWSPPRAWGATAKRLELRLAAEERYDDAELLRDAGGAGQLMSKLTGELGLSLSQRTFELKGLYAPDLMVRHGSGTVGVDQRGTLEARTDLSRQTSFQTRAQAWRVSDPTSLPRLGMARSLVPVLYGRLDAGLTSELGERFQGRVGYRFEGAQVYEPGALPGLYHAPFVEARFLKTRRTELGLEYRFQYFTLGAQSAHGHGAFALLEERVTRHTTASVRLGPIWFFDHERAASGVLPRATLEVYRAAEGLELGASVGQDLVGASGFTSALWASFASVSVGWKATRSFKLLSVASAFRNGRALAVDVLPFAPEAGAARGYAVGGAVEWGLSERANLVASFDRFAQVAGAAEPASARNIAALRLVVTAF